MPRQAGRVVTPEFWGVDECEIVSGISRWTWRKMAYDGRVSSTKVGRRLLIPASEVRRILDEGARPRVENADGKRSA